jgi:hypothetical protein
MSDIDREDDSAQIPDVSQIPSPFDELGRLRLQCWYCGEGIEYRGFDPCAVIIVSNWDDEEKQREQQFWAHAECFRRSGSGTNLYVFDDD